MNTKRGFLGLAVAMLMIMAACANQSKQENEEVGLWRVSVDNKWGFVDKQGNVVVRPQFEDVGVFGEGLASVEIDGKWGYIDKQGTLVINPQFEQAHSFSNGLAEVKIEGKFALIDKRGKVVYKEP